MVLVRYDNLKFIDRIFQFFNTTPIILLFATIIVCYAASAPYFYHKYIGIFNATNITSLLFLDTYTFVFFFAIPLIVGKIFFDEEPVNLGLRWPINNKTASRLIAFAICFVLPITLFCAQKTQFKSYYSFGESSVAYFIFVQMTILPTYYFSEEFFFRGFLFLILWRKLNWHSFWITDIFFTLAHLGKPGLEIILSIPASIVLNYLTLRTKSILPAIIVHATIGIMINTFVNYNLLKLL